MGADFEDALFVVLQDYAGGQQGADCGQVQAGCECWQVV